ncbi:hypothetical protein Dfer_3222 [Dyadobacter fermentans DSM 18053]|uniref:Uncharacterized protein n=1 Tax=Dyadobacter fermentans (strain ATCC 700827 / DSM 18053 / CIP 107007 / KCTC 52180 / NS114) TaxID=471854 RepID=C6W7F6_DYAFD|nr:hypothetical protein Dfer_3222 [Dyadobacter fermentans DSM 18053]
MVTILHDLLFLLKFYQFNRKYRFYTEIETGTVKNEP